MQVQRYKIFLIAEWISTKIFIVLQNDIFLFCGNTNPKYLEMPLYKGNLDSNTNPNTHPRSNPNTHPSVIKGKAKLKKLDTKN